MLELVGLVDNPFREELLAKPLTIRDGFVMVPTGPGLGVEVDEDKLRFYSKR
jgi:L-alanine-DL-glutamate epimerase-like enolase superfamily enzyme